MFKEIEFFRVRVFWVFLLGICFEGDVLGDIMDGRVGRFVWLLRSENLCYIVWFLAIFEFF